MRAAASAALVLGLALSGAAAAQSVPQQAPAAVAVIDQNRLIADSALGREIEARLQAASRTLVAENRQIEAALEEEERQLTARRASLPQAEFQTLAAEFDARVEAIREAQELKSRSLARQHDEERQRLLQRAVPILAQLMKDRGAAVLLDRGAIVLSLEGADLTDAAIAALDAQRAPEAASDAAPADPPGGAGAAP
ncbi:periplasmic chaperone for outer membrane proteins Skp [Cereibacter ovatus]|uniref:Periplasmic chaperone for outer membrane proteins Skp n=1 Tax=Cereibacter ovatus TaxID=439529 RepID=A0A285CJ91_9RHOB|nr:OmpH family outer membrane protein [Cereibacter ovatus]SNX67671.1 periplasmic chaperone for outer membrane proteins Skp [Cereibacter ovatus]